MIRKLLMEADVNQDGLLSYEEYCPVMIDIISALRAKDHHHRDVQQATQAAQQFLCNGVPAKDLERAITKAFMASDTDHSGALDPNEFIECVRSMQLGLTKKEILYLLTCVDMNHDGLVQYHEFVPLCLEILSDIIADQVCSAFFLAALFALLFPSPSHQYYHMWTHNPRFYSLLLPYVDT